MFRRQHPGGSHPIRGRRPGKQLTVIGCVAVAMAFLAGCGSTSAPAPAASEIKGAVLTLVTAPSISAAGEPVHVSQYFPVYDKSVTAVALVGRVDGPTPLIMSWYRVSPDGSRLLFTKTLTVSSFGLAYTTVVSAGTLPFGLYRVVAAIGDSRRSFEWTVYTPQHMTTALKASGQKPLALGRSGTFPAPTSAQGLCQTIQWIVSMPSITDVHINVLAYCPPAGKKGPVRGDELASMNQTDGLQLVGPLHLEPNGLITGNFNLDVCGLQSASDLPGKQLYLNTIVYFRGSLKNFTGSFGLPAEHAQPVVRLTSSVPPGTVVHPGERIRLKLVATEPAELGPQEGIRYMRIKGPDGVRIAFRTFRTPRPGCGRARLRKVLSIRYTVPDNAPSVLTLNAFASDTKVGGNSLAISFPVTG